MKKVIVVVTALVIAGAAVLLLTLRAPVTAETVESPMELTFEERAALEIQALRLAGALDPVPAPNDPTPYTYVDPTVVDPEFEERAALEMTGGKIYPNSFEQRAAQELAALNMNK